MSRIHAAIAAAASLSLMGVSAGAYAAVLPGLGEVSGQVAAAKDAIIPVYLSNPAKNIGYEVFAVNGAYRAVDLMPGHYDITVRKNGFTMEPQSVDVAAGGHATVNLNPKSAPAVPTYVLGVTIKDDPKPEPYDKVYPAGPGREIAERTCLVCHSVNFLPNHHLDRDGWQLLVDLMSAQPAFTQNGIAEGPTMIDPARFPPKDKETLLDYLVKNYGPDSQPVAVIQDKEPPMDAAALSKAEFIEYRAQSLPEMQRPFAQETHFDSNGNVLISDRAKPPAIVKLDPRTGETKTYLTPDKGLPHGLTVDADNTVWWVGPNDFLGHLDPTSGLTDLYPATELGLHGNTPVFTSNGDIWFSVLLGNKIGHWSRATNSIVYYEIPSARGRPYGMVVDHHDKVWFIEYHTEHVTRFDPDTEKFTQFTIKSKPASMRRLGVDSKDIVWFGVYGTVGNQGKLGRLDPKTGEITEIEIPVQYANPYDATPNDADDVWVSMDNYLVKYHQHTGKFTIYPLPERTDEPKISVTRDDSVWYPPRAAGTTAKYGAGASVLYPDKDKITTLGAFYSANNVANRVSLYKGPPTKVTGAVIKTKDGAKNPEVAEMAVRGKPLGAARTDAGD